MFDFITRPVFKTVDFFQLYNSPAGLQNRKAQHALHVTSVQKNRPAFLLNKSLKLRVLLKVTKTIAIVIHYTIYSSSILVKTQSGGGISTTIL